MTRSVRAMSLNAGDSVVRFNNVLEPVKSALNMHLKRKSEQLETLQTSRTKVRCNDIFVFTNHYIGNIPYMNITYDFLNLFIFLYIFFVLMNITY